MKERRIRLIVTGDLEHNALTRSIRPYWPCVDRSGIPFTWLGALKTNGATSYRLQAGKGPWDPMRKLARAVLAEALDGEDGTPSDLVVAIDDLEIHNVDQPAVVCDHFRRAFEIEFERKTARKLVGEQEDARALVRERCSFHLVSPMIESYLFGEHDALVRAGAARSVKPML